MPFNFLHARVSDHFKLLQITLNHFKAMNMKYKSNEKKSVR